MAMAEEEERRESEDLRGPYEAHVIATFRSHKDAEDVVRRLLDEGFPPRSISLIGKDFAVEERPVGFTTLTDAALGGTKIGALWGGIFGLLTGFTFLVFPVAGPLVAVGPLAAALVSALEGAAFGGLAGVLIGWGLQRERAVKYETALRAGQFVLTVSGPRDRVARAETLLQYTSAEDVHRFPAEEGEQA